MASDYCVEKTRLTSKSPQNECGFCKKKFARAEDMAWTDGTHSYCTGCGPFLPRVHQKMINTEGAGK